MKIHEYQGKELLGRYGVPVPRGIVARSPEEAYHAAKELGTEVVVVKAQIHAGGRGKGGGVKLARSADEAQEIARQMLGMKLKTHQTGPSSWPRRRAGWTSKKSPRPSRRRFSKRRLIRPSASAPFRPASSPSAS